MSASMKRPTPSMARAMRNALWLEKICGEAWVRGTYRRTAKAIHRRGWADEYRVTPRGQVFYRLNPAGRELVMGA